MLERLFGFGRQRPQPDVSLDTLGARPREDVNFMMSIRRKRGQRGIYAWYADAGGQEILRQADLCVRRDGLVYVGSTTTSFRERIRAHVMDQGSGNLSETLKCVLGAISPNPYGGDVEELMRTHFKVAVMPRRVRKRRFFAGRRGRSSTELRLREEERQLIREADAEPGLLNRDRPSTMNAKRIAELCERAKPAVPDAVPAPVKPPAQPQKLKKLGRFRRDFWAHVSRRHPDEAPPGWASGNVYRRVEVAGRRVSLYLARDGVGVFFPREPGESSAARTAAVRSSVKWLRAEIRDAQMTESGWLFLKINSRDRRNWDRMADWLHDRRLLYERALRDTAPTRSTPR